jgi:hypothetical protein
MSATPEAVPRFLGTASTTALEVAREIRVLV